MLILLILLLAGGAAITSGFINPLLGGITRRPPSRYVDTSTWGLDHVSISPLYGGSSSLEGRTESDVRLYSHMKVAMLGGGAFSLAMSKVLSYKNISISMLVREESVAQHVNEHRYHPKYLTDSIIPVQVVATVSAAEAINGADLIVHAVPMQASRSFLTSIKELIPSNIPILSVSKGVEKTTHCLMSEVLTDVFGPEQKTAYLSGPSFAKEIMNEQATAVVIASEDEYLARQLAEMFSSKNFRCHTSRDVKGVELGGAIKNVVALAAGMCEGLDLGMNAMSSLITRGCTEMRSMGKLFGAEEDTFGGLSGVGDTFGTCLGPLSRNRQVGNRLAKGEKLEDILRTVDGVSEGVATALALEEMLRGKVKENSFDFKFPIISGVAQIIKGRVTPQFGLQMLMRYPVRDEIRSK